MMTADTYQAKSASREYRPEWTWLAEDSADGALLAVAVWWASPQGSGPSALDGVFVHESVRPADRISIAAGLLAAAHSAYARAGAARPPDYHVILPGDWRERPGAVTALAWRQEAARRAGLTASVERLRYEWTAPAGLPELPNRLRFRAEPDDEVFVDLFRRVLVGTLDAASRTQAAEIGADAQARRDVAFYRDLMAGDRSWWRIAAAHEGGVIGFGLPSRNPDFPVVGYLGVLPEYRGRGYGGEILAEVTRILVAEAGAQVIRADTDLANLPMAKAFEHARYRNFARRLVLSAHR
jgi:hypothetical protein